MTYRTRQHVLVEFYRSYRIAMRRAIWSKMQFAFKRDADSVVRVIRGKAY